ncbi:sulfite exporter TauE/SafE family protein [Celeribacter arenosi]|uniref:Probable membrane transporter protein n=1 Tax=Celeribacter arenosi TaxID=792649 RepID=A0ABP7JZR4_9RHOB
MIFDALFALMSPSAFVFALALTAMAGFVKGATGFAMPMIMISGLGSFLPPDVALAGLIVPTMLTNLWQSFRGGMGEAVGAARDYRLYIAALLVVIVLSAQLVTILPDSAVFLSLGIAVIALSALLMRGFTFYVPREKRGPYDIGIGALSGLIGGISGIWGPLTIAYLTATDTPKKTQIRVTGVIFASGAIVLFLAHLRSGVLNAATLPLSAALVLPALLGMGAGQLVQDRLDQVRFRRVTLVVLMIAGLNLLRRGLF